MVKSKKKKANAKPVETIGPVGSASWLANKEKESASASVSTANEKQTDKTSAEVASRPSDSTKGAGASGSGAIRKTSDTQDRRGNWSNEAGAKGERAGQTEQNRSLGYTRWDNSASKHSENTSFTKWDTSPAGDDNTSHGNWNLSKRNERASHTSFDSPRQQGSARRNLSPKPYERKPNSGSGSSGEPQYFPKKDSSSNYRNKRRGSGEYNYSQRNRDSSPERPHSKEFQDHSNDENDSIGFWNDPQSKPRSNFPPSTKSGDSKFKGRGNYNDNSFQSHTKDDDDSSHWPGNKKSFQKKERPVKQFRDVVDFDSNSSFSGYEEFCKDLFRNCVKVTEIDSDLFQLSKEYSLAHCVAEDMAMGSGIAVNFRRDFKRVDELYAQRQKQGGLAVLDDSDRFIYYLVTKRDSNGKPTLHTLFSSLLKMQKHVEEHQVQKLAMPRIGCGLDRLEWSDVKAMLEYVFRDANVEITVCNFQQPDFDEASDTQSSAAKLKKSYVMNVSYSLAEIESGTIVVYLGYEDGYVSPTIESLDNKFTFVNDYKTNKRDVGDIITSYRYKNEYVLCGFIVAKDHSDDDFNFIHFQKCITALSRWNSKKDNKYSYVGIQAFLHTDKLIMTKVVNLLRYGLQPSDIYVCWPGNLTIYMPRY